MRLLPNIWLRPTSVRTLLHVFQKHRWGVFPSASVGWRITEEKFMKNQRIFDNLKLRVSWGQLGNQNGLGMYDHIASYNIKGYYPFKSELGQWAVISKLPSETRTWETVEMNNFAVDMAFLRNRLTVTGEYFIKRNKDMLVNVEVPSVIESMCLPAIMENLK